MISISRKAKGFTLIELLVVMSIALTAVALVSGLAIDSHEKFKVKAETLSLRSIFRKISNTAFIAEEPLSVIVKTDRIQLLGEDKSLLFEQRFEQITFTPSSFTVNELGVFQSKRIQYFALDKSHSFSVVEGQSEI